VAWYFTTQEHCVFILGAATISDGSQQKKPSHEDWVGKNVTLLEGD